MIRVTLECDAPKMNESVRMPSVPAKDDFIRYGNEIFKVLRIVHDYDKQYGNYHIVVTITQVINYNLQG